MAKHLFKNYVHKCDINMRKNRLLSDDDSDKKITGRQLSLGEEQPVVRPTAGYIRRGAQGCRSIITTEQVREVRA